MCVFAGNMTSADDSYGYLQTFGSYGVEGEGPQSFPLSALNDEETGSLVSIKMSCFEVRSNSPICVS